MVFKKNRSNLIFVALKSFQTYIIFPTIPTKVVLTNGKHVDNETLKANKLVLTAAAPILGLRVSVPACQVHVQELYTLMDTPCPSSKTA